MLSSLPPLPSSLEPVPTSSLFLSAFFLTRRPALELISDSAGICHGDWLQAPETQGVCQPRHAELGILEIAFLGFLSISTRGACDC